MALFDQRLEEMRQAFPQVEALANIRGIGLYSALLIVAEIGELERFRTAKQVGAYTGLTSRIHQSGGHNYQGSITRQGSPWLRWVLVLCACCAANVGLAKRSLLGDVAVGFLRNNKGVQRHEKSLPRPWIARGPMRPWLGYSSAGCVVSRACFRFAKHEIIEPA